MNRQLIAAHAATGRKNRPRCGSARRKLREEREAGSAQSADLSLERRVYQPGGVAATPVLQAPTSTAKGRQGGGELERGSEMSLRELHSARVNSVRDEEARIQAQDEAKWVEAEQLVAALKASKEEPPSKPRPPVLHSNGQVDKLIFAQPSMNSWVNEYKYK